MKLGSRISFMSTSASKLFQLVFYCSVTNYPETTLLACSSKCFLFPHFCWSGIQEQLSQARLSVCCEVPVKVLGHRAREVFYLFVAILGLRRCARAFSSCGPLRCALVVVHSFSPRWLLLLPSTDSKCTGFSGCSAWAQQLQFPALEHRLSSCGPQA